MSAVKVTSVVEARLGTANALLHSLRNSGKIFTAVFVKKDNTIRKMNCRFRVIKHVKGTGAGLRYKPVEHGLANVFDLEKMEYRSINLDTLLYIKFNGTIYLF